MYTCMLYVYQVMAWVWKSENNLQESVLSYHMGSRTLSGLPASILTYGTILETSNWIVKTKYLTDDSQRQRMQIQEFTT